MSGQAALERSYRRMLAWFPAQHRNFYAEEMVGVLLAAADDGQRRPRLAERLDLVLGGLRTRFRSLLRVERLDPDWRDALAAFSVAAPVLMLVFLASQLYNTFRFRPFFFRQPYGYLAHQYAVAEFTWVLMTAATAALVIALIASPALIRRQQRRAMILITLVPALLGLAAAVYFDLNARQFSDAPMGLTVFFALEVLTLASSRDPGRGWRVLGWKSLIVLAVAGVFAVLETFAFQSFAGSFADRSPVQIATAALAFGLVLIFGSNAIKRTLALLAIPGYPILVSVQVYSVLLAFRNAGPDFISVLYLPTLAIAVLVALAMWQSSRHHQVAAS